jgi:hypothetical protein
MTIAYKGKYRYLFLRLFRMTIAYKSKQGYLFLRLFGMAIAYKGKYKWIPESPVYTTTKQDADVDWFIDHMSA